MKILLTESDIHHIHSSLSQKFITKSDIHRIHSSLSQTFTTFTHHWVRHSSLSQRFITYTHHWVRFIKSSLSSLTQHQLFYSWKILGIKFVTICFAQSSLPSWHHLTLDKGKIIIVNKHRKWCLLLINDIGPFPINKENKSKLST